MARITLTQKELENMVEKELESACAYHAIGEYKLMFECKGAADAYLYILDDNMIWYGENTINEHVQEMLDLLDEEARRLNVVRF